MTLAGGTEVIVAYATRHGSTAEIAERIAKTLRADGISVQLGSVAEVDAVMSWDAIVCGSPVYDQRWLPEGDTFVAGTAAHSPSVRPGCSASGRTAHASGPSAG